MAKEKIEHRMGKYLLMGRIFTNIGDSIIYICVVWFLNEEFHSPILLSLAFGIMSLVDAGNVLVGPFIDRTTPKKNLFSMSLLQNICIAGLLLFGMIVPQGSENYSVFLLVILLLTYMASSVIYPAGEKLIPTITKGEELVKMNSFFHISEKVLDIAFNAISSILISFLKQSYIIGIALMSFVLATTMHKRIAGQFDNPSYMNEKKERYSISIYLRELREGISEIGKRPDILMMFLPLSIVNIFYGIAMVGLPVISSIYISEKAYGYGGVLLSASAGGILGAVLIAKFARKITNPHIYTFVFLVCAGISWLLIPITVESCYILVFVMIFISNCAINMMNVMFITIIQQEIPSSLLGRVSTFTQSLVSVMIPVGNLGGGFILSQFNPIVSQVLYGVALILCGIPFAKKKYIGEK